MHLKLEIRVVCREFLAVKYEFIILFEKTQIIIYFCTSEILCGQVENAKWILCKLKIGVKCVYLRFLM